MASCRGLLAAASHDLITIWDVEHLAVPILGVSPAPVLLHSMDVTGGHPVTLQPSVRNPHLILAVTSGGRFTTLDVTRGRCLASCGLGHLLGETGQVLDFAGVGGVHGLDVVIAGHGGHLRVSPAFPPPRPLPSEAGAVRYQATDEELRDPEAHALTLPGQITRARVGSTKVLMSHTELHRFLTTSDSEPKSGGPRTDRLRIDGHCYAVEQLTIVPEGTLLELSQPFHRDIEDGGPADFALARLRPRFTGAGATPSHRALACVDAVQAPVCVAAFNPQGEHLVLGCKDGSLVVWGYGRREEAVIEDPGSGETGENCPEQSSSSLAGAEG
jgi:hypothetical protein